ncbi:MAG: aryl-sulfate sulfotransferase [Chitinophagaceae bacterium]|nr:aryl-sulfate sulfotransferase [Chitinophagaceae bacterium]
MKITCTFFAFALSIQIVSAQFSYVSPMPGSLYHNPQTNIILLNGQTIDAESVSNPDLLEIVGSVSGNHTWKARLSDDNKTVVIKPVPLFAYDETVYVIVNNGLRKSTGEVINGTSFSFQTRKAITPEQQARYKKDKLEDFIESFGYNPTKPTGPIDPNDDPQDGFFETPDSFPSFKININNNPAPGKIFYGSQQELDEEDTNSFPTIIENDGTLVWARDEGKDGHDFKINPSGYLSYYSYAYSWWKILDSNYNEIDSVHCGNGYDDETNGHDFQMYADGHYYVPAFNDLTIDMTAYGGQPDALVKGYILQELDQNKDVIFQWRSWDHFLFTDANQWTPLTNSKVDYVHGNACSRDLDGNVIISCRNMDEVTKINRQTGDIIWRMGGENNQFTFVDDNIPQHFSQQHDARRIANGNITLFNNGNKLPPEISSAKEYQLDEVNKIATLVWYYEHPDVPPNHVFGRASGNAQRLPNGNTMISWGTIYWNKDIPSMTEVDSNKNIVWEMTFDTAGQKSYRTYKFEWIRCAVPVDSTLTSTFYEPDSVVVSWGDPNNSSSYIFEYKLSTEVDWITIPTTENFISIDNLIPQSVYDWRVHTVCEKFTDTSTISNVHQFNTIGSGAPVQQETTASFSLYPNPAVSGVTISLNLQEAGNIVISLTNALGQEIHEESFKAAAGKSQREIKLKGLPAGAYTVQMRTEKLVSKQQLVIH